MAIFGGHDLQVESGFILYGGVTKVRCTDENQQLHETFLKKRCLGLFAGVSASLHPLSGINGEGCPEAYTGTFTEYGVGVGVGVASIGGFIATKDSAGRPVPKEQKVTGGGAGIGLNLSPVNVSKCFYSILQDDIL